MYRNLISLLLLILPAMLLPAQKMSRYELDVKDFIELKVVDGVNVDYRCNPDSAGKAVFYTTPDKASVLVFSNNKNRLDIRLSEDVVGRELPTVVVYSQFLVKAENIGDSTLRVLSVSSGPKFNARLVGNGRLIVRNVNATQVDASINTGNGALTIYGKCSSAKFSNTGTGSIQGDGLAADNVKCVQVGTGSIGCMAQSSLLVYGASGKIYYKGSPAVKNRSVGVELINL